jgi:uncharacterized coiled-coil DUF342 family protein
LVALCAGPAWSDDPGEGKLVIKIHELVTKQLDISLYGVSEKARADKVAGLKKKYARDVKALKDMAAKGTGKAKELQDALTQFETNVDQCSKCEHGYRNLIIDLVSFEECKKKSCDPVQAAWEKIATMARAVKKSK